ncbi:MAG: hypothetical protein ABSF25_06705 [Bryobacteraceae bacterium]|jgi:hypothetical protein
MSLFDPLALRRPPSRQATEITLNFGQVAHNFETVLDSIKRLENIAAAHEQRLDDPAK